MNNYQLIQNIKIRRALWDKTLWDRIDTPAREVIWEDVAEQMKSTKEIVKARWKNLRDSYRKLLLRVVDNPQILGTLKWRYFQHMDFIKDIVLCTKSKVLDISLKGSEIVSIEPDYSVTFEGTLESSESSEDPLSISNEFQTESEVKIEKGVKRKAPNSETGSTLSSHLADVDTEMENKELEEKLTTNYPNDDDLQFLLSLYPHFKQVSMTRKLPLRMKIERIIHEELYDGHGDSSTFAFKI